MTLRPPIQLIIDRFEQRMDAQGGRALEDACRGEELPPVLSADGSSVLLETAYTNGCGGATRFAAPYNAAEDGSHDAQFVTACVVDDGAYLWPRFRAGYVAED